MNPMKAIQESNIGNICEDELIFKHKKFGTKKREYGRVDKNADFIDSEVDPLEETSRRAETLKR